jgi:hypothetical protein
MLNICRPMIQPAQRLPRHVVHPAAIMAKSALTTPE